MRSPGAAFLPSSAFLRALNSARRRSSSLSSASCSAATCRFTSRSISACISASVSCFWQEQNIVQRNNHQQTKKLLHVGIRPPSSYLIRTKQTTCRRPQGNQCVGTDGEVAGVTITVSTRSRRKRWILAYTAKSAIDPRMMSISTRPLLGTRDDGGGSPAGCVEFTFEYRSRASTRKLHSL
jgi:hypothetical protein